MAEDITHLLVVPHTHWDREWYLTFQQFRMRLVRTVDLVLDTLETDPSFAFFMLDGQTIVLEDYLEVRPENRARLERLARAGRILVGPWYLQPDEFLVGAESLVRNLQIGRRMGAAFGDVMPVGYVPDTFGHIAQLPQILRGVGLDNAVFWRGVGPEVERGAFRWAAPDGSEVLAIWLYDDFGYSNAAILPLEPEALATRAAQIAERMRPLAVTDALLLMNGTDHIEPQVGLPAALAQANERLRARNLRLTIGTLPQYIAAVKEARPALQRVTGELAVGWRTHLLPGVYSTRIWLKQRNAAVEALLTRWAEPATAWASAFGAAYPASLLALAWKHLLHNHPHDSICGCGIDQVHREMLPRFDQAEQIADELTRQALAHLAGCADTRGPKRSVPIVVFNPSDGPRTDVVSCTAQLLFSSFDVVDDEGRKLPYQVHKSSGAELLNERVDKAFAVGMLGMLSEGGALGYAVLDAYISAGGEPGVVRLDLTVSQTLAPNIELVERAKERLLALAAREDITTFHIIAREAPHTDLLLLARDVPARGGRVLYVRPRGEAALEQIGAMQRGTGTLPLADAVRARPLALENAHLRIEVDPADGTLTLTDKHTRQVYTGLNRLSDGGDVGDLYNYSPPARDTIIDTPVWPPSVEIVEPGPARATLRVTRTYLLPASCAPDRQARSPEQVTCAITSDISLAAGGRRVEICTTVENTARDHRLRALFPVPFTATYADADGAFAVTRRPARQSAPGVGAHDWRTWIETPVDTHPQQRFVDVADGERGLAVLNRGLPEYEVLPDPHGAGSAVALTLLRAVGWLSRDDLATRRGHAGPPLATPEAQGLGPHIFEYALAPHPGDWRAEDALALREAQAFEAPLRAVTTSQHAGPLGARWSFVYVTPAPIVVSAVKRAEHEDALVVRLYNPLETPLAAEVILALPFREVVRVDLNEDAIAGDSSVELARILSTGVHTRLRGGEIQTVLFRLRRVGDMDE